MEHCWSYNGRGGGGERAAPGLAFNEPVKRQVCPIVHGRGENPPGPVQADKFVSILRKETLAIPRFFPIRKEEFFCMTSNHRLGNKASHGKHPQYTKLNAKRRCTYIVQRIYFSFLFALIIMLQKRMFVHDVLWCYRKLCFEQYRTTLTSLIILEPLWNRNFYRSSFYS